MNKQQKRFILPEDEIPRFWYNIQADMKNKPLPPLNPATKQPLKPEDLYPVFAQELCKQELNQTDTWIEIPEEVREMYKYYRSTPLVRAYGLEKALDTPAHIYFKNESVSPIGSHKLNSALAQAYYCKKEGVTNITTETGAGQWGAALSYAANVFGLEATNRNLTAAASCRHSAHRSLLRPLCQPVQEKTFLPNTPTIKVHWVQLSRRQSNWHALHPTVNIPWVLY